MWHAPNHWKHVGTRFSKRAGEGFGGEGGRGGSAEVHGTETGSQPETPASSSPLLRPEAGVGLDPCSEESSDGSGESLPAVLASRARWASVDRHRGSCKARVCVSSRPADITRRNEWCFRGCCAKMIGELPASEHQLPSRSRGVGGLLPLSSCWLTRSSMLRHEIKLRGSSIPSSHCGL